METKELMEKIKGMTEETFKGFYQGLPEEVKKIAKSVFEDEMKALEAKKRPSQDDEVYGKSKEDQIQCIKDVMEFGKTKHTKMCDRLAKHVEKSAGSGQDTLTGSPEYGYVSVPTPMAASIMEYLNLASGAYAMTTKIPIVNKSIDYLYENGGDQSSGLVSGGFSWAGVDELGQISSSRGKLAKVTLTLHKYACMVYVSPEAIDDSIVSMLGFIKGGVSKSLVKKLDDMVFNGTGTNSFVGILDSSVTYDSTTGLGITIPVAKEAGQTASLTYKNLVDMYFTQMNPSNATWFMSNDVAKLLATLYIPCGTNAGYPVFLPATGASGQMYGTLFGRPVVITDSCAALGSEGDIVFADLSEYLVGEKGGIRAESSLHFKFDYDQICWRFIYRADGKPWMPSPLVGKNGYLRSPFVTLEAR